MSEVAAISGVIENRNKPASSTRSMPGADKKRPMALSGTNFFLLLLHPKQVGGKVVETVLPLIGHVNGLSLSDVYLERSPKPVAPCWHRIGYASPFLFPRRIGSALATGSMRFALPNIH